MVTQKVSSEPSRRLLAMGIKPLTGLTVGEEAVTWSALGRALERGLGKEDTNHHYTLEVSTILLKTENPELHFGESPLQLESGPPWKGWAAGQKQRDG